MLKLYGLQRALMALYRIEVEHDVDDFVRCLDDGDPEAARGEVVLVSQPANEGEGEGEAGVAVMLHPAVMASLAARGANDGGALPRFRAWCMALEGVSHFTMLAWNARHDRPVSQLDLELQAEVDKFAVSVLTECTRRAPGDAHTRSRRLREALFERVQFLDASETERGARYRLAHRLAWRYARSLERRYVREGRLPRMVEELRDFYRSSRATRWRMIAGG